MGGKLSQSLGTHQAQSFVRQTFGVYPCPGLDWSREGLWICAQSLPRGISVCNRRMSLSRWKSLPIGHSEAHRHDSRFDWNHRGIVVKHPIVVDGQTSYSMKVQRNVKDRWSKILPEIVVCRCATQSSRLTFFIFSCLTFEGRVLRWKNIDG